MQRVLVLIESLNRPLAMLVLAAPLMAIVLVGCSSPPPIQDTNQADWAIYYGHIDEPPSDD